ncbi:hypothetical protein KIW84_020980 [Lathyrus oleraceus]|uniref:Uncharacterized protein n=1 Tax=Pisum sativum TaxID=3888 RepID=A0A9D4YC89_PEA|nr:hypothetical protein KIW84_020980 [Pisum sativum]
MINDSINHLSIEKSFRIKQDDRFFSRLKSKEASSANTSSRILYYGETSIAIPFVWEEQPVCSRKTTHASSTSSRLSQSSSSSSSSYSYSMRDNNHGSFSSSCSSTIVSSFLKHKSSNRIRGCYPIGKIKNATISHGG